MTNNNIEALAFDARGDLWMGSGGGGVFRSRESRVDVFDSTNSGLPNNAVRMILIDRDDNKWIATQRGVAVFREGGVSLSAGSGAGMPAHPSLLEQNFPNPFNPSTTIAAEWPVASRVKLTVYDLLGREIAVLVDGVMPPGRHTVRWDAETGVCAPCPSGVYFYRLEASPADGSGKTFLATRRMILVK